MMKGVWKAINKVYTNHHLPNFRAWNSGFVTGERRKIQTRDSLWKSELLPTSWRASLETNNRCSLDNYLSSLQIAKQRRTWGVALALKVDLELISQSCGSSTLFTQRLRQWQWIDQTRVGIVTATLGQFLTRLCFFIASSIKWRE